MQEFQYFFEKFNKVKVTKISAINPDKYQVGYFVEGYMKNLPEVGEQMFMYRYNRNGEEVLGQFNTSEVKSVEKDGDSFIVETRNSTFKVELIGEKNEEILKAN